MKNDINQAANNLGKAATRAVGSMQTLVDGLNKSISRLGLSTYELITVGLMKEAENYMLWEADPKTVVQYILQKPNNTWHGVTIWPDESWRYECKSDWMWWRENVSL